MEYVINPYVGVSELKFGMSQKEIHAILGEPKDSFKRNEFAKGFTETYSDCFVNYDAEYRCEAIEFFGKPEVKINNIFLFSTSCAEIRQCLGDIKNNDSGYTSFMYGVGIYAPDEYDEPDCLPESVIVFRKGYYD